MKKWLRISFGVAVLGAVIVMMSFASSARKSVMFTKNNLYITIDDHTGMNFIDAHDVLSYLDNIGLIDQHQPVHDLALNTIEEGLALLPHVKNCEVWTTIDGKVHIAVTLRKPVVRIIHTNGMSNYIDDEGNYMPLSRKYTAHVPVFTGDINESANRLGYRQIVADSALQANLISDDIFVLAQFIRQDEFLSAQIEQVVVDKNNDMVLIPKVGDHKIVFGGIDDMPKKFKKLKVFYKEGLRYTDWEQFDTINLKFKDQIVCTKK
jgi:cell division protein FtsQ